jgi:hypothetical protein
LNPLAATALEVDVLLDLGFADLLALELLHHYFDPYRNLDSDYLVNDRFFYYKITNTGEYKSVLFIYNYQVLIVL